MQSFLDSTYATHIDNISKYAYLKRAKTTNGALKYLSANAPKTILITD